MPLVTVDTRELSAFASRLAATEPKLRLLLRRQIVKSGQGFADAVKEKADWSSRIPGATRVRVSFAKRGAAVRVGVSKSKAPEARPLNNNDKDGTFRHPVFADGAKTRDQWRWVEQDARPFFQRAIEEYEHGRFQAETEATAEEVAVMVTRLT